MATHSPSRLLKDDTLILSTSTHVNLQTPKRRSMPWCAALGVVLGGTEERKSLVEKGLHEKRGPKENTLQRSISEQIRLDVARAFCFPAGLHLSESSLDGHRQRLFRLICIFFMTNRHYHYFQGFHEIYSLFLLVFEGSEDGDDRMAGQALQMFADSRLRPFLLPQFELRLASYAGAAVFMARQFRLKDRFVLAERDERELAAFDNLMARVSETIDLHGLLASWFLTWFANEFTNFSDSLTVFDFQMTRLRTHLAPAYIAAALLMVAKRQLMELDGEGFELVLAIRTLPKTLHRGQIPLVLETAQGLYSQHCPPERLIRRDQSLRLGRIRGYGGERLAVFRGILPLRFFGGHFWAAVIVSHFLYYLVIACFPGLRNY